MKQYTIKPYISDHLLDELCKLYHNYSLVTYLYSNQKDVTSLQSVTEGQLKNIFIISIRTDSIEIHNSFYCNVDSEELSTLLEYLFTIYNTKKISWAILLDELPIKNIALPSIEFSSIEDNIATLPETYNEYLNSLGHQTKKHSKYYVGRMVRDFPTVVYIYKKGKDVTDEEFDSICHYSIERMAYKSKSYAGGRTDGLLKKIIKHDTGFGFFVKINGEVKAGCLGYILGEHLYLRKIAHDVELNYYNVGNVVLLKLIEYCIEHRITKFHFLWGKNVDYKVRFGAKEYPLYSYFFYRSKGRFYLKDNIAIHFAGLKRKIKTWLKSNQALWKIIAKVKYKLVNYER